MPSQFGWRRHYNVDDEDDDDDGDKVVPLHCEEAFKNGLTFKAKFIGSMVVPRPTRRMEIVVAMRQVRYNTKAKQTAKVKCLTTISVKGVRSIRRPSKKKKNNKEMCGHEIVMMNDPIYRIFYVSHDSHDLNVWSYIARDGASNTFRCNVFKCTRKSKAMKVVRTIGQAFEVCHKITQHQQHVLTGMDVYERIRGKKDHELTPLEQHAIKIAEVHGWRIKPTHLARNNVLETDIDAPATTTTVAMETDLDEVDATADETTPGSQRREKPRSTDLDRVSTDRTHEARLTSSAPAAASKTRKVKRKSTTTTAHGNSSSAVAKSTSNNNNNKINSSNSMSNKSKMIFSTQQHIKLLQQQAQLADQQAQIAANQVKQLRVQLKLEINARNETQARNHRLLVQNRELIQQLSELVTFIKMTEAEQRSINATGVSDDGPGLGHSERSDLPGMISLSNLQQIITENESRPCTTVIANDRLENNSSSTLATDLDRIKQERRNGISGHSYFTSSSDDSSLQTLTNRLSESHPGSCSSDSSTSSDEDENLFNQIGLKSQHHMHNSMYNGFNFQNEDEEFQSKSKEKLKDSFSDTSISALTEDSLNQNQQNPSTPMENTSIWTTGNTASHLQLQTPQTTADDKKLASNDSFTLSPIFKASTFTDVTPLNFEESFVSRVNTDLDGSFSDLRKLDNASGADSTASQLQDTKNESSTHDGANTGILITEASDQPPQLDNGASSYFDSMETNFDNSFNALSSFSTASQETNNNNNNTNNNNSSSNNNSTNPFRPANNNNSNVFSEPSTFEAELRYEPLRKVQAAERWRGKNDQVFNSLTQAHSNIECISSCSTNEPSLNSFLDSLDTTATSTTTAWQK